MNYYYYYYHYYSKQDWHIKIYHTKEKLLVNKLLGGNPQRRKTRMMCKRSVPS